jgi:hypothetical protein
MVFPGCPETFEEPQGSQQGEGRRFRDSHQKVNRFREGDIIAVPTGVAFWMYNDQETPVIAISLTDMSSSQNQLDQMPRVSEHNQNSHIIYSLRSQLFNESEKRIFVIYETEREYIRLYN